MVATGISIFGAGLFGAFNIARLISESENDIQNTAYVKWGTAPETSVEWFDDKAQYDLVAFTYGAWDDNRLATAREELQSRNLDILLGTYYQAFTVAEWTKRAYEAGRETYGALWWERLSPYLAVTTEQDTAAVFKANYIIDIFNPKVRTIAISMCDSLIRQFDLDWVMIDFISTPIPNLNGTYPQYEAQVHGDLDLDRDCIGHWDDPDEQEKLRLVWAEYIKEMRETFPPDVKLIPNGSLAIKDPTFASIVDGCYIEMFPQFFFGDYNPQYKNALDPNYRNSLYNLDKEYSWYGRQHFILIEDVSDFGTYGYIAKLFDNVFELKRMILEEDVSPPIILDTGKPVGEYSFYEYGAMREFEKGKIRITFNSPYEIECSFEENEIE